MLIIYLHTHGAYVDFRHRQLLQSSLFWPCSEMQQAPVSRVLFCTVHSVLLPITTVLCLPPTPVVSFSIYSSPKCVFGVWTWCVYSRACMGTCDGILIEPRRSGGPSGAVNQNNGEPIMGALHFTGAIWLAITKKQIAMMANKILTEALPSSMMGWNRYYFIVIESYWQH